MKKIILTQGYAAIVDDEDFAWLSQWKWYAQVTRRHGEVRHVYAKRRLAGSGERSVMHIDVAKRHGIWRRGKMIDHVNHDGLDNRQMNLRVATNTQNHQNRRKRMRAKYRFKGVGWNLGKWVARICVKGKAIRIGSFDDEMEAVRAYDAAALKHFGRFAATNLPLRSR